MRLTRDEHRARLRTSVLVLAAIVALTLVACGDSDADEATAKDDVTLTQADPTVVDDAAVTAPPGADGQAESDGDAAQSLPARGQMASSGRYASDQLGVTVEFTTPRELFVTLNEPGRLGMVSGFNLSTGEYPPETGIALGFRRWGGWATPEEATHTEATASIDPYDVDAWSAANDVVVLGDETREIAGRSVRVFDVTVDPQTDVAAAAVGNGACFEGWEPCFYTGVAVPAGQQMDMWISAKRTTRFYLFAIEGSEPLMIAVGAPPGDPWFDEVESSVIASLTLGPDAPPAV